MTHEEDENGEQVMTTWFGMNGVSWHPDHMAGPEQPMAPGAKSARIGDTIEWEVRNNSMMAHPYHLHGFSYQPYALVFGPTPITPRRTTARCACLGVMMSLRTPRSFHHLRRCTFVYTSPILLVTDPQRDVGCNIVIFCNMARMA